MTREETKKMMPIIEAFVAGKTVLYKDGNIWVKLDDLYLTDAPEDYKIAPEKKYIPFTFEDRAQFRGRWIKDKETNEENQIIRISEEEGEFETIEQKISFMFAFDNFVFLDGSPFGKLSE
jgi:hypothetical protein